MEKIDFVVTWVDGSDKAWQAEKKKYRPGAGSDDGQERYRDWDNLRYWFRGVEKFAPWVHKVYFVTWGHLPQWLNTEHPKLVIVRHTDYIPQKYLPTFSSHPIELNLHRIQGLSEQFVYFNDDTFLTAPVRESDFFQNALPCDSCIESAVMQDDYENPFAHILLNNAAVLNKHFNKKETIHKNRRIWFHPAYGSAVFRNLLMYPYGQFSSFKFFHAPSAFLKDTFYRVWEAEPGILDQVCQNRFRSVFDVSQYLMKYWQYATGKITPVSPKRTTFLTTGKDDDKILDVIRTQKYRMTCVNDGITGDFEQQKEMVKRAFESILPKKSSFER